jgi:hypothetical protein
MLVGTRPDRFRSSRQLFENTAALLTAACRAAGPRIAPPPPLAGRMPPPRSPPTRMGVSCPLRISTFLRARAQWPLRKGYPVFNMAS